MSDLLQVKIDDSKLAALIAVWMAKTGKTMNDVLLSTARSTCETFMQYTLPRENFRMESKVRGEVQSVYVSRGKIYKDLKDRAGSGVAAGFWSLLTKRRAIAKAKKMVEKYSIYSGIAFGDFDGGAAHKAARTGPRGNVPKGYRGATVILETGKKSKLEQYIQTKVDNVGMAKAGWYEAWKALKYARGAPRWVTRNRPGKGNFGTAIIVKSDTSPSITIHNRVTHAEPSMEERYKSWIFDQITSRMIDYFRKQLRLQ